MNSGLNTRIVSAFILGGHIINPTNNHTSTTIVELTKQYNNIIIIFDCISRKSVNFT